MFTNFWYEIYESLKRKPTRAILTGIGIAWGIFILILLVGIGSAFERGVFKIFSGFSKSMTYVYASETSLGYKESQAGGRQRRHLRGFVVRLSVIFWKGQPAVYYETNLLLTILIKFKS